MLDAVAHATLQGWPEVPGAVRHLLQVAGDGEDNVEMVARGREKISEEFEILEVVYDEAWSEDMHVMRIHSQDATGACKIPQRRF